MASEQTTAALNLQNVPVTQIRRDEAQPRRDFDESRLAELVASVRQVGVLEPIELRPDPQGPGNYVIVYGERRWRAAQAAGLATIPAIVRTGQQVRRRQLYENVMRADLNLVELAENVANVLTEERLDTKALAEQLGWPLRKVQRLVEIDEAPALVKDAIRSHVSPKSEGIVLSQRHALDLIRAYRHYAREDSTESKERATARFERLLATVTRERWSVDRLQEYVGALGRSPKRDPLDRPQKARQSRNSSDVALPPDAAAVVQSQPDAATGTAPAVSLDPAPPLFTEKAGRFTVHVDRARACSDAAARIALSEALRRLTSELGI
jgi:ParB family chromosome partitioning protein